MMCTLHQPSSPPIRPEHRNFTDRYIRHGPRWVASFACRGLVGGLILASCTGQSCTVSSVPVPGTYEEQVLDSRPDAPPVKVTPALRAEAGPDQVVYEGDTVTLQASAVGGSGEPVTFIWEQVDGPEVALESADTPNAYFLTPDVEQDATIVLRVRATDGQSNSTDTVAVQVLHVASPAAVETELQILASVDHGEAPLSASFSGATLDGTPLPAGLYAWSFGDGNTAEGPSVTYTFNTPGTFVVTLCATLGAGLASTVGCKEKEVTVDKPIVAPAGGGGSGGGGSGGGAVSPTVTIAGTVRLGGVGLADVTVSANNGGPTVTTSAGGAYQLTLSGGWSGTVSVQRAGYTFTPASRVYNSLGANQTVQDYEATAVANTAPTANAAAASTQAGAAVQITMTGADADGHSLSFSTVTGPAHGTLGATTTLTANSARVTYTPAPDYSGSDTFTFRAYDGAAYSAPATVSVTVIPVNRAPVALAQSVSVQINTTKAIRLTGTDADGDALTYTVLTPPAHGTLTGTAPDLTYTPSHNYQGADSFTFRANDGALNSSVATVNLAIMSWTPPIGIPAPAFGVTETPPPYDAANPLHYYVDNTGAGATDSANANGSPAKPRVTIPSNLPAGAYVEVRGGPYSYGGSYIQIAGQGTPEQPIFVVGIGMPRFDKKVSIYHPTNENRYIILQGLSVYKFECLASSTHVTLRHSEVRGSATGGGATIASFDAAKTCSNIVLYNNVIRDNGDWLTDGDQDIHGVTVTARANNIWVVDNEMYHNSGDGLQINAGSLAAMPTTHHIYVGRNVSHSNKQAGLWTKQATDVIFSQNTCHTLRPMGPTPSAYGSGLGFQYGPERVWFLYNHVYNTCFGISSGSTSGLGDGQDCYLIGNVLHDIHHHPDYAYTPTSAWSNAAITLVGTVNRYIINNTIYNVDAGINTPGSGPMYMVNNIISNVTEAQGNHVFVENAGAMASSSLTNCLLYQNGDPVRIRWANQVRDVALFHSVTGQAPGSVKADPQMVNPDGGDFRLQAGSPGVDAGVVSEVYATFLARYGVDISVGYEGNPRSGTPDIGAYER